VEITVAAVGAQPSDEVRSLRRWLVTEDDLRGRVRLVDAVPEPGTLGAMTDVLMVTLGPAGAATVFAGALVTWIRHRTGNADYKLTRPDGTVIEVSAQRVRGLDAAGVQALVGDLARTLDEATAESAGGDEPGGG
jgi:hypothetical protein